MADSEPDPEPDPEPERMVENDEKIQAVEAESQELEETTAKDISTENGNAAELSSEAPTSQPFWNQFIQSPLKGEQFSPALELSKAESLHGTGFRLALEKSRAIGLLGHRLLLFLNEISSIYETYGVVGLKCVQFVQPKLFPPVLKDELKIFYDSMKSFALDFRKLAVFYKTQICDPLEASLTINGVVVTNSNQRYTQNRQQCKEARQKAIAVRRRYVRAVRNSETVFETWKKTRATATAPLLKNTGVNDADESSTMEGWEKTLQRLGTNVPGATVHLVQQLKIVQSSEEEYRRLVAKENMSVDEAREVENLGIEDVQKVVEGRLDFFLDSVVARISGLDSEAIEDMPLASVDPALLKKQKDGLFANLFTVQNFKYDPGTAMMEADSFGFPADAAHLRVEVKQKFSARSELRKVAEALKEHLNNLAAGNSKLNLSLKIRALGKSNPSQTETILELALSNLGPKGAKLFENILQIFDNEAEHVKTFSQSLIAKSNETLTPFLDTCEEKLQAHIVADDAEWKQLCDAARFYNKAEARYNQVKTAQERNRERIASVDTNSSKSDDDLSLRQTKSEADVPEEEPSSNASTPSRLSKFNILAGKEAMKKLREDALSTISKMTINEEREANELGALNEAKESKDNAISAYKSITEDRIKTLEAEDKAGWEDMKNLLESITEGVTQLLSSTKEARESPLKPEKRVTLEMLNEDIRTWLDESKKKIQLEESRRKIEDAVFQETTSTGQPGYLQKLTTIPEHDKGFKLKVMLEESPCVYKLLELSGDEEAIPELEIDAIEQNDSDSPETKDEHAHEKKEEDTQDKTDSAEDVGGATENGENGKHSPLRRSLTTPVESTESEEISSIKASSFDDGAQKVEASKDDQQLKLFIKHFWADKEEEPPEILQNITCSYRTKNVLISPLHGRLFTTIDKIHFLAVDGKNFSLHLKDIVSVGVEKTLLDLNNNSLTVSYLSKTGGETVFTLGRLESRDSILTHLRGLLEAHRKKVGEPADETKEEESQNGELPPVPPDETIKKMETVLSRILKNVPIPRVYDKVWSEGNRTSEAPFYGPWLKKEDCFDIALEDWEFASDDSDGYVNPWDGERYSQRRMISFKFQRTTHLYIGPPVAIVKQQQFCRVEGKDKCVLAMCVTFEGIPYSDTFAVEVRWIATRKGADVLVEVGLFVDFRKSSMLKNQIKTGTISETKNVHNRLFEAVRNACTASKDEPIPEEEKEKEEDIETPEKNQGLAIVSNLQEMLLALPLGKKVMLIATGFVLLSLSTWGFGSRQNTISASDFNQLVGRIDELQSEVQALHKSLDAITALLTEQKV